MATRHWVGGTGSKSWNDTANWSATAGGTGGATVPVSNDTVYVSVGVSNIDSGLDQSAVTGLTLTIAFAGSIGTSSTSLTFGATCVVNVVGTPTVYLASTGAITIYGFENSSFNISLTGGVPVLIAGSGTVVVSAAVTAWLIVNLGASIQMVASNTASSGVGTINCYAGVVQCGRPMSNATDEAKIYGGVLIYTSNATIDDVLVSSGGTYYHASSANITTLTVVNGVASAASATGPFTVTTAQLNANGSLFADTIVPITYGTLTKYCTNRNA